MTSHEIDSAMILVHPLLAIAGYAFIFVFAFSLSFARNKDTRLIRFLGLAGWLFTFFGLVTGMVWAQIAWSSYWSWDPKETSTLVLLLTVSASFAVYNEKKLKAAKWLSIVACFMSVLTASISFVLTGLHSFV